VKLFNLKTGALLVDSVCTFALTAAALNVVLPYTFPVQSFGFTLLLSLVSTLLILLFSRKWWIFPITLCVLVPTVIITLIFLDPERTFFQNIQNIDPMAVTLSDDASASSFFGSFIPRWFLSFGTASMLFLYFRKMFLFLLLPPLVIGIITFLIVTDPDTAINVVPLVLFVFFVSLSKLQGKRSARIDPDQNKGTAFFHVISAGVILIFVVPIAFFSSPKADGDWQSQSVNNWVEDIVDITHMHGNDTMPGGIFNLSFSGFSPLGNRLGGDVVSNHLQTLQVQTETPIPLGGVYFDTYSGYHWYNSQPLSKYRFNALLTASKREYVFGTDLPEGGGEIRQLRKELITEVQANVTSSVYGRSMFASGKITAFSNHTGLDASSAFFNENGELFITENPRFHISYDFESLYFIRDTPDFDKNMLRLEELTRDTQDIYFRNEASRYLQLPDALPQSVRDYAVRITEGLESPYQKALAIETWLSETCVYTLTPGNPPQEGDFVEHFLNTREGYCVYYASAMTVLARCVDIPARYVNGFVLNRSPFRSGNHYIATNATAHAWTEIYLNGIGWVPFDALGYDSTMIGEVNLPEPIQNTPDITRQASPTPTEITPGPDDAKGYGAIHSSLYLSIISVAVIAFLIYVSIRVFFLFMPSKTLQKWLISRHIDISGATDACYRRTLKQFMYLGYVVLPGETIRSFSKRIDSVWFDVSSVNIFDMITRLRFADLDPTEKDLALICDFSASLERKLIRSRGLLRYLLRRLFFGSI